MPTGNGFRPHKNLPSFNVMVTIATFIAFGLLALWVLSSPSNVQTEIIDAATISEKEKSPSKGSDVKPVVEKNSPIVEEEESPESNTPKTEEKKEESVEELESKEDEPVSSEDSPPNREEIKPNVSSNTTGVSQSEIEIENKENTTDWESQLTESKEEKEKKTYSNKEEAPTSGLIEEEIKCVASNYSEGGTNGLYKWEVCQNEAAKDYIPCLDNKKAIKMLQSTMHYEHRERHCPEEPSLCLVPLPKDYRSPIHWPQSRDQVWYSNVPHPGLVSYKKDQNWVKKSGEKLLFPGGGTQFKHGARRYIDYIQEAVPDIAWGKHTRVILDVGCGVASFGGYLADRDVLAMSFAPKDEHEAQVQLALERGIPAIVAVMGTQRLPFPSNVYDIVHCARCRVPWHIEGGKLLLELNRVLRPGGYFVWSATPVYWNDDEDVAIWKDTSALADSMCWKLVSKSKDPQTGVGVAIFQKPESNSCYENRNTNEPPMCDEDDNPDSVWYIPMTACLSKVPSKESLHSTQWPAEWPQRVTEAPIWLKNGKVLNGEEAALDFESDTKYWQRVVDQFYNLEIGIDWSQVRNVMDMKAGFGGFGAALAKKPVWVMNVVPTDALNTLSIIFDRGLLGIYHDWCESFNTYPRTYDLLHADHLFSRLKKRCGIHSAMAEMDRILRPDGWAIIQEKNEDLAEIEGLVRSLHWEVGCIYSQGSVGFLIAQKKFWRPDSEQ